MEAFESGEFGKLYPAVATLWKHDVIPAIIDAHAGCPIMQVSNDGICAGWPTAYLDCAAGFIRYHASSGVRIAELSKSI